MIDIGTAYVKIVHSGKIPHTAVVPSFYTPYREAYWSHGQRFERDATRALSDADVAKAVAAPPGADIRPYAVHCQVAVWCVCVCVNCIDSC